MLQNTQKISSTVVLSLCLGLGSLSQAWAEESNSGFKAALEEAMDRLSVSGEVKQSTAYRISKPHEFTKIRQEIKLSERFFLTEIEGDRKWIFSRLRDREAFQLFDLLADPDERRNLVMTVPEEARKKKADMLRRAGEEDARRIGGAEVKMSEGLRETLEALGYLK